MNPDEHTRPEKAAELAAMRRMRKRYEAAVERRGQCFACKYRSAITTWGRYVCRVGDQRQFPACQRDGLGVKFELDGSVMGEFSDAA